MDLKKLLSWIPGWLGFLALIIVGTAMTIWGAVRWDHLTGPARGGFVIFGVMAVLVGLISWIVGGTSEIKGRAGKVGVKVEVGDMPWYGWVIDLGLIGIAIVVYLVAT